MCDTIQEFDQKNDKAHAEIRRDLNTGLKTLEDSLIEKQIELGRHVENAVEKMDAASSNLKASTMIQNWYKAIVVFLLAVISGGALMSYTNSEEIAETKIKTYQTLVQISDEIQESKAITISLDTKALMDTIQNHFAKQDKFYHDEYLPLFQWTHKVLDEQIIPSEKRSKKNEIKIKILENR